MSKRKSSEETNEMTLTEAARQYIGQKEKPGNSGFIDPNFDSKMRAVGWRAPWAWCGAFVKLCISDCIKAGAPLLNLANMGAVRTFNAYHDKGMTGNEARPDSIAVWRHYKNGKPTPLGEGHIGPVTSFVHDGVFDTTEGNSNVAGAREGDRVIEKQRPYTFDIPTGGNGLRLLGFIYPEIKQ